MEAKPPRRVPGGPRSPCLFSRAQSAPGGWGHIWRASSHFGGAFGCPTAQPEATTHLPSLISCWGAAGKSRGILCCASCLESGLASKFLGKMWGCWGMWSSQLRDVGDPAPPLTSAPASGAPSPGQPQHGHLGRSCWGPAGGELLSDCSVEVEAGAGGAGGWPPPPP